MISIVRNLKKKISERRDIIGWHTDSTDMSLSELWVSGMDREAWRFAVHGVTESNMTEWLTQLKRVELTCVLLKSKKLNMCGDGNVT